MSVIVPNYNKSHYLKRCVLSILNQTYSNLEIIVVDNHSTDDSLSLLGSIADSRLRIYSIHNYGVIARSRNFGVNQANYDLIAFCDSDDYWLPAKLESQIKSVSDFSNLFSYTGILLLKNNSQLPSKTVALRTQTAFNNLFYHGNVICTSSVLLSKSLFLSAGSFCENTEYVGWEDFYLWLCVMANSPFLMPVSDHLVVYDQNELNHTKPSTINSITHTISKLLYSNLLIKPSWVYYSLFRSHLDLHHFFRAVFFLLATVLSSCLYPKRLIRYLISSLAFYKSSICR